MGLSKSHRVAKKKAKSAVRHAEKRSERQACNRQINDGDGEDAAQRAPIKRNKS